MSERRKTRVTIGMPVFNGEKTVAAVIESLLQQTFADFQLIISDNASTDATSEICSVFARQDSRIRYIRQAINLGAEANFDYVLQEADCEYFMWAAADDMRSRDFLALCVDLLDKKSDYVGATCPTRFEGMEPDPIRMGDRTLCDEDANENIIKFFEDWHANGRFYSLFRRKELGFWLHQSKHYLGADWALIVQLLKVGKFRRLDSGHVELGRHGASNQLNIFSRYRSGTLQWIVPFLDLSRIAMNSLQTANNRQKFLLVRRLCRLNLRAARTQIRHEAKLKLLRIQRSVKTLWRHA
ncbi:glycosyltransferase family 2 protein [Dyella choica]|uniref:Glycosyltransferase family 2 protein n=1 Tax=Dyella choica TaxID=1927959 RepID=A0A3S0S109_9GAMM|nr:glycosyltransferase family 2 protein [Dyella choica]RUL76747.1 glycosyltransferase family 2 protein [Dyella choica]